jgi:hypothetical protein
VIPVMQIVVARAAIRAYTLRSPFRLHHRPLLSTPAPAPCAGWPFAMADCRCQSKIVPALPASQ